MVLYSSRKDMLIKIGIVAAALGAFVTIIMAVDKYTTLKILEYAGLTVLLVFSFFGVLLLPMDITADEGSIYISKYFKKHVIAYREIKTVELYWKNNKKGGAPMMTITKKNGEEVTQSLAIMNDKNTNVLLKILSDHKVNIYNGRLPKNKNRK